MHDFPLSPPLETRLGTRKYPVAEGEQLCCAVLFVLCCPVDGGGFNRLFGI